MKSGACLLILAVLAFGFFSPNIVRGGLMLPIDVLYHLVPFASSVPQELETVHNPLLWDLAVMIYPWIEESRASGWGIPLWNPYSFCGSPLLANGQTGLLHPLSWTYRLLPLSAALIVVAAAKLAFSGIFALLFFRKLRLHPLACLFGAIAAMFGSAAIVWLGYPAALSLTTMPFLFWALENYLQNRRARDVVWMALGFGLMYLGGGLQTAFLISLAGALYFAIAAGSLRLYAALAIAALLGFCLAAPQLLPFLEYLKEGSASHFRGGFGWKTYPWFTVVLWAMPRFFGDPRAGNFWGFSSYLGEAVYIGIAPLILAAAGLALAKKDRRYVGMLAFAACGFLGLYCAPLQELLKRLPFLSHLDNNKFPALLVFGAVYFAAAGFDVMLCREGALERRRARVLWAAVALFWTAAAVATAFYFREAIGRLALRGFLVREALLQLGVLAAVSLVFWLWQTGRVRATAAAWALLALTTADLWRLSIYYYPSPPGGHSLPDSQAVDFLQQHLGDSRFLGLSGWLPPETSMLYRLQDVRGIDGHTPFRHYQIMGLIDPRVHDLRSRLLAGAPPQGKWTSQTLFFESLRPLLDSGDAGIRSALQQLDYWSYDVNAIEAPDLLSILGVRYLLGPKGAAGPAAAGFPLVYSADADIWENPTCLPRAFVSTLPVFVNGEAQALQTLSSPDFLARRRAVIDLQGRPAPEKSGRVGAPEIIPARIIRYDRELIRIQADAAAGGWLVLSDLYYPGWEASIDGGAATIIPANFLFRGVALPPGSHQVEFRFRPRSYWRGLALCLTSLVILAGLLLRRSRPA